MLTQDTRRIEIYTGRPLRVIKNKSNDLWASREAEMRALLAKGVVPISEMMKSGEVDPKTHFGGPLSRHSQVSQHLCVRILAVADSK